MIAEELLGYAEKYLEEQLRLTDDIDNKYLSFDSDQLTHVGGWVYVENPSWVEGVHDSPYYRAEIANELNKVREMLGR